LKATAIVEHNYGIFIQLLVMECLLSIIKNDFGIISFTNGRGEKDIVLMSLLHHDDTVGDDENKLIFFISNQFCSFKTRLSVFKSNFKKRSFPWQHRAFSMETSPNPRGPEKREV
jgi:hypothetical protein